MKQRKKMEKRELAPMKLRTFYTNQEQVEALKTIQKRYRQLYKLPRSLNDFVREGISLVIDRYKKLF